MFLKISLVWYVEGSKFLLRLSSLTLFNFESLIVALRFVAAWVNTIKIVIAVV